MSDMSNSPTAKGSLWLRLLWMIVVSFLMGLAQTLVNVLALVQLIVMATAKGAPNAELQGFGKRLGQWLAKAARYQAAESDERPWPWSRLD